MDEEEAMRDLAERQARVKAAQGICCPDCGCKHFETTHVKHIPGVIRRRHVCQHCGRAFWSRATVEK